MGTLMRRFASFENNSEMFRKHGFVAAGSYMSSMKRCGRQCMAWFRNRRHFESRAEMKDASHMYIRTAPGILTL